MFIKEAHLQVIIIMYLPGRDGECFELFADSSV